MRARLIQKPCNSICHIWKPVNSFGTEGVIFLKFVMQGESKNPAITFKIHNFSRIELKIWI